MVTIRYQRKKNHVKLHGQFWVQFQDNFVDNFRDNVEDNFGDNKNLGSIFVNSIATKGTFQSSCQSTYNSVVIVNMVDKTNCSIFYS